MNLPRFAAPVSRHATAQQSITPQSCTGDCVMKFLGVFDCSGVDPSTFSGAIACAAMKGVAYNPATLLSAITGCGISCAY